MDEKRYLVDESLLPAHFSEMFILEHQADTID